MCDIHDVLQDDAARRVRLKQAGKDLKLTDEQRGQGQQNNTLLELQRAARRPNSAAGTDKVKRPTSAAGTDKAAEPSADAAAPQKVGSEAWRCFQHNQIDNSRQA